MTMRATQKNKMSWPVSSRLPGKKAWKSSASSLGQPMVEKGKRPEENQVSRTSGSCDNDIDSAGRPFFSHASLTASSKVLATTQLLGSEVSGSGPSTTLMRYAGIRCPHQSWREMHQWRMLPSHQSHFWRCKIKKRKRKRKKKKKKNSCQKQRKEWMSGWQWWWWWWWW